MEFSSKYQALWRGSLAAMPLSIAVIPWGILAGSFAIDAGMNVYQAQAMSAILFAGSAQLVISGMLKAGAGLGAMLLATLFITSRHLLYSVSMRDKISPLSGQWRVLLGHLLTDELFAICGPQKPSEFHPWYALGVGGSFYLVWNLASFAGIVLGSAIPSLQDLGLEFAVAATFIAIVIPHVKTIPVLMSVITSFTIAVVSHYYHIQAGLILAAVGGMLIGYITETSLLKPKTYKTVENKEAKR